MNINQQQQYQDIITVYANQNVNCTLPFEFQAMTSSQDLNLLLTSCWSPRQGMQDWQLMPCYMSV